MEAKLCSKLRHVINMSLYIMGTKRNKTLSTHGQNLYINDDQLQVLEGLNVIFITDFTPLSDILVKLLSQS